MTTRSQLALKLLIVALASFLAIGVVDLTKIKAADDRFDGSFGANGQVVTSFTSGDDNAYALEIQSDGKMVVAGCTSTGSGDFAVARYNIDGSLDSSFGQSGIASTAINSRRECAYALEIQSDGKILAGGGTYNFDTGTDFAVVRYNVDGSLDSSFGQSGIVTADWSGGGESVADLLLLASGKILVGGSRFWSCCGYDFMYAQYLANGAIDTSLTSHGYNSEQFVSGTGNDELARLLSDSNGRIIAVGESVSRVAIAKYQSDNKSLDGTFGTAGKVVTDIGENIDVNDAEIQPDGKIVVIGTVALSPGSKTMVLRYNPNGTIDQSFGTNGRVTLQFGSNSDRPGGWYTSGQALAIQSDGQILIGGSDSGNAMVARLTSEGLLDVSLGGTGMISKAVGLGESRVSELSLTSGGQIVGVGSATTSSGVDFFLWRLQSTSSLPVVETTVASSVQPVSSPVSTVQPVSSSVSTVQPVSSTVNSPKVTTSKPATAKSIATYAKIRVPSMSKVSLKVVSAYAKYCKVSGTTLKGLKAGSCKVTVTVTPKKGRAAWKTVTLKVTK